MDGRTIFPSIEAVLQESAGIFPIEQCHYLINGIIENWDGPSADVWSPVCTWVSEGFQPVRLGSYPLLTENEAYSALDSARAAFNRGLGDWPQMPVSDRIRRVQLFAKGLKAERENIARLLMWEIGKPQADALKEIDRTLVYIANTIEELKELDRRSSRFVIEEAVIAQIKRVPLGIVLCMGPFNYPINETFATLIPALLMGNCVILKPPRLGVLLYEPLLKLFRDCFPAGVVNVLYGEGEAVIDPLMTSGDIDVLAFIGTTRVANILKQAHPKPNRFRCSLGLEAKNAAVILPDADLDLTVKECVLGTLSFNGQRCTALKILFVHQSIVQEFLSRFSAAITELKKGMPYTEGVFITPLPDRQEAMIDFIADAKQYGAEVYNPGGGERCATFVYPAVLYPVNEKMRIYHEEQFGPIIPVVPYSELETPLEYVVTSGYGQQASIFGKNPDQIAQVLDLFVNQVSRVNINSQCQRQPDTFPFTGRKDSAEGTLSVFDALRVFSIRTLVAARENEVNKEIINEIVHGRKSGFLNTDFIF